MFRFIRYWRASVDKTAPAAVGPTVAKFLAIYAAILVPFLLLVGYQSWASLQLARTLAAITTVPHDAYAPGWPAGSLAVPVLSLMFALVLGGIVHGLARNDVSRARSEAALRAIVDDQLVDITELHQTRSALSKLSLEQEAMLDNELVGIVKVVEHHVAWVNKGFRNMLGYTREDIIGNSVADFYPDRQTYDHVGETAYRTLHTEGRCRTQQQLRRKDGALIWVDMTGVLLDSTGNTAMWLLVDITQVRQYQEKVEFLAYHDSLTGLPNRLLLSDRLIQSIALAERHERGLAVCYLDLDGFKAINDQYGHSAGDRLLREVARRLLTVVRVNDTVCRVGGDEFVLVLTHLDAKRDHAAVLQRVIAEIAKPIALGHQDPNKLGVVSASIGVALYPTDGRDADALIRHADQAMYQAKQLGRNQVCAYAAIQPTPPPAG